MNLESDIEDLLSEYSTTIRVYNALTMYEGIKQIKDLINEDGSFVGGPRKPWIIPNIGKKSVEEIDDMRRWFVKKYLEPDGDRSMKHMPVSTAIQLLEETIFACSDDPRLEEAWGVVLHLMQDYRRIIKEETS